MGWELVRNGATEFAIDWEVVRRLLQSYKTAQLQYDLGKEVPLSESHWYNPFSWSMPDVTHVEVDWALVGRNARAYAEYETASMRRAANVDARPVARRLEYQVEEAGRLKEAFVDWMGTVQTENMHRINRAVEDYESNVEVARFFRDRAGDGLMVGASLMTGGAALAVMGGGSIFKGAAKFQDTGSVGAGVMEGVGTLVFAYVKLGKKFSFKQDMMIALVQAPYKAGTELVAGASLSNAVISGGLKLIGPGVDRLFKTSPIQTLFDRVAVPLTITQDSKNVASSLLQGLAKNEVNDAIKNAMVQRSPSPASTGAFNRPGQVIESATLTNKHLLYLAFVNMQLGIGRGW